MRSLHVAEDVVQELHAEADVGDGDALVVAVHALLRIGDLDLERIEAVGDDAQRRGTPAGRWRR